MGSKIGIKVELKLLWKCNQIKLKSSDGSGNKIRRKRTYRRMFKGTLKKVVMKRIKALRFSCPPGVVPLRKKGIWVLYYVIQLGIFDDMFLNVLICSVSLKMFTTLFKVSD